MANSINDVMASLPTFLQDEFKRIETGAVIPVAPEPTTNGSELALIAMAAEELEPPVEHNAASFPDKIMGSLLFANSHIQIFDNRFNINGSIQIPGLGTYWCKFQNLLVAEDKLYQARGREEADKHFGDYLYETFILPMRPAFVDSNSGSRSYQFAASPLYDENNRVAASRTFCFLIWEGNDAKSLLIINGTQLIDVPLRTNPNLTNPKSPKWEGDVKKVAA